MPLYMAGNMVTDPYSYRELVRTSMAQNPDYEIVGSLSDEELKEVQKGIRDDPKVRWRKWTKKEVKKFRDALRTKYPDKYPD